MKDRELLFAAMMAGSQIKVYLRGSVSSQTIGTYVCSDRCDREIEINPGLSREDAIDTIIHELVHAALAMSGLGHLFEDNQEEALSAAIGALLGQALGPWIEFPTGEKKP